MTIKQIKGSEVIFSNDLCGQCTTEEEKFLVEFVKSRNTTFFDISLCESRINHNWIKLISKLSGLGDVIIVGAHKEALKSVEFIGHSKFWNVIKEKDNQNVIWN